MIAFMLTVTTMAILVLVRNAIVYKVRDHAIDIIFDGPNWQVEGALYLNTPSHEASYTNMVLDLRKWTFAQFYPELAKRVRP